MNSLVQRINKLRSNSASNLQAETNQKKVLPTTKPTLATAKLPPASKPPTGIQKPDIKRQTQTQKNSPRKAPKCNQSSSSSSEHRNKEDKQNDEVVDGYFSMHSHQTNSYFMDKTQQKLDFFRTENLQLKCRINDLQQTLEITKEAMIKPSQDQASLINNLQSQLKVAIDERDKAQAECLIASQVLAEMKMQESEVVKELTEENLELKDKLDRTEFIIQYKEEIWTCLEREIRKVVDKDSELLKKCQQKTRILTDCLAQTKVSTVVKQNAVLEKDQKLAIAELNKLIQTLGASLQNSNAFRSDQTQDTLKDKVKQASQMIDSLLTIVSVVEDENNYFRQKISHLSKELNNLKHKTPRTQMDSTSQNGSTAVTQTRWPVLREGPGPEVSGHTLKFDEQEVIMPSQFGRGGDMFSPDRACRTKLSNIEMSAIRPAKPSIHYDDIDQPSPFMVDFNF